MISLVSVKWLLTILSQGILMESRSVITVNLMTALQKVKREAKKE